MFLPTSWDIIIFYTYDVHCICNNQVNYQIIEKNEIQEYLQRLNLIYYTQNIYLNFIGINIRFSSTFLYMNILK